MPSPEIQIAPASAAAAQKHILVVEDDEFTAGAAEKFLLLSGFKVTVARDGEEAWRLFTANVSNISLVLTDLRLPGISGRDFVQRIRDAGHLVKIIVVSGYLEDGEMERLFGLDVDIVLAKPMHFRTLARVINQLLGLT